MNQNPPEPLYAPPGSEPRPPEIPDGGSWAKVIGIIGIVFGGGALLLGVIGVVGQKFALQQYEAMGISQEMLRQHDVFLNVSPIISLALGFLLLLGGILLVMKRPVSRTILLIWAMLKIGFALWQAPLGLAFQKELVPLQQKMLAKGDAKAPDVSAIMETIGPIIQIISVLWLCALPIFILIWFMRAKIRMQVSGWAIAAQNAGNR